MCFFWRWQHLYGFVSRCFARDFFPALTGKGFSDSHRPTCWGILDDVFFASPSQRALSLFPAPAPGSNLLVGVGAIISLLRWKQFKREPGFWVNTAALFLWGGCAFGWVPSLGPLGARCRALLNPNRSYPNRFLLFAGGASLLIQCAYRFKGFTSNLRFRRTVVDFLPWPGLIFGIIVLMCALGIGFKKPSMPWAYFCFGDRECICSAFPVCVPEKSQPLPCPRLVGSGLFFWDLFRTCALDFMNFTVPIVCSLIPGPRTVLNPHLSPAIDSHVRSRPFRALSHRQAWGWTFFVAITHGSLRARGYSLRAPHER